MSNFVNDGYRLVRGVLSTQRCDELRALTDALDLEGPGTRRLLARPWCQAFAREVHRQPALRDLLPPSYCALQCTYFEKSSRQNWLVPVHQDLSVPVAAVAEAPGWGPWSSKEGSIFVQPPIKLLEALVAVRMHLDPCAMEDGPLVVVPGTHRQGAINPEDAAALRGHEQVCTANAGDALVFRPLLLHRSSKASGTSRRRVLHLLFGPSSPAPGVEWERAARATESA